MGDFRQGGGIDCDGMLASVQVDCGTSNYATVYSDNTVAASIFTNFKCPRPPRLQRWGIELG
eukprot:5387185-Pleurochrysis_carterae.AAC.1